MALAAACATMDSQSSSEAVVKQRAQARWDAMVQGDLKAAYGYFSPGSRTGYSLADFGSSIRIGFWKAVTVDRVECNSPDRCDVMVTIEYLKNGMRIKTPHRESWIRDGSEWWFLRR
jgi:hypothetical protein